MAIQNYKKFINKRQNNELTDITPDFGELVVGKDRVIVGLGDNTIYNTKEKELELERLQYYGDKNIVPSDESYFKVQGNTVVGLTDIGKANIGSEVVIPYKINNKLITKVEGNYDDHIGAILNILYGSSGITKVILPNSITDIGDFTFYNCTSLVNINIPNSVTIIRDNAFLECTGLTSIEIPDSVTSIGSSAFESCTKLTSINIPDTITSIGDYAFENCTSLKTIKLSNAMIYTGVGIFSGCTSLKTIKIPDSVTDIAPYAFQNCTSLEKIEIPSSVTAIDDIEYAGFDSVFSGITPSRLTIYCEQGSYAETYAQEKGFNIVYTDINKDSLVGQKTEDGGEIFNDYVNNIASGYYSHAEGYKTKAYANYSHVEGNLNFTYGIASHAEGKSTNALTNYSHAEGVSTKAGRKCFKVIAASGTSGGEGTYTLDSVDNLTTNLTITLCESNGVGTTDIAQTYDIGKITAIDTTNKIITVDKFFTPTMNNEDENANSDYYIYANDKPTYGTQTTIFINTHAEGQHTEALGIYSHAEGYYSKAYGEASHAECASQANGKHSHAEGSGTTANGLFSHTEGFNTKTGLADDGAWAAHAEGWSTKALFTGAHSEGNLTYANNQYAHAEGDSSIADGESSHSEGKETTANTIASHAEGYKTNAGIKCFQITSGTGTVNGEGTYILDSVDGISTDYIGNISGTIIAVGKTDENKIPTSIATIGTITALDSNTKTITVDNFKSCSLPIKTYYIYIDKIPNIGTTNIINYTHVEGIETQAFGYGSHAEGYCSLTKGNYSHAEGASQAIGECSHSEGNSSIASGQFSHAEGFNTQSKAIGSHSEGEHTQANAEGAHAEGKGTIANGGYSHAEGDATEANEAASHSEGRGTKASAPFQHVEGKYNIVDDFGDYAHIIGNGESDTARSNALTVDWNGNLWIAGGLTFGMIDTLPTASASYRGKTIFKKDDTNGDKLYICLYNGSAYEWKEL